MNEVCVPFCSIILAGGKSRRLGRNKLQENVGGQNLVCRAVSALAPVSKHVYLVTSDGANVPFPDSSVANLTRVSDIYPGCGTLGGIYTGLKNAATERSFVAGCDMPFISGSLVKYLMEMSRDFDLVIPRVGEFIEPLHAVYSRSCLDVMERQLKAGNFKVAEIVPSLNTRYVTREEMDAFDPQHLSFFNVNTQHDLQLANGIAEAGMEARGARNIVCGLV